MLIRLIAPAVTVLIYYTLIISLYVMCPFLSFSDELNRKMDHKRQEITDCQQTLQQLKEKVHSLRVEKVMIKSRILASTNSH